MRGQTAPREPQNLQSDRQRPVQPAVPRLVDRCRATSVGPPANWCQEGQGTSIYPSGERYAGSWIDDKRNGQGTSKYPNGEKSPVNLFNLGVSMVQI